MEAMQAAKAKAAKYAATHGVSPPFEPFSVQALAAIKTFVSKPENLHFRGAILSCGTQQLRDGLNLVPLTEAEEALLGEQ